MPEPAQPVTAEMNDTKYAYRAWDEKHVLRILNPGVDSDFEKWPNWPKRKRPLDSGLELDVNGEGDEREFLRNVDGWVESNLETLNQFDENPYLSVRKIVAGAAISAIGDHARRNGGNGHLGSKDIMLRNDDLKKLEGKTAELIRKQLTAVRVNRQIKAGAFDPYIKRTFETQNDPVSGAIDRVIADDDAGTRDRWLRHFSEQIDHRICQKFGADAFTKETIYSLVLNAYGALGGKTKGKRKDRNGDTSETGISDSINRFIREARNADDAAAYGEKSSDPLAAIQSNNTALFRRIADLADATRSSNPLDIALAIDELAQVYRKIPETRDMIKNCTSIDFDDRTDTAQDNATNKIVILGAGAA
jgi:hypothetical protein